MDLNAKITYQCHEEPVWGKSSADYNDSPSPDYYKYQLVRVTTVEGSKAAPERVVVAEFKGHAEYSLFQQFLSQLTSQRTETKFVGR